MTTIKEGNFKKGGVNKTPSCKRPNIKPPPRFPESKAGQNEAHCYPIESVNLFRVWFNAVQDLNPSYLDEKDYKLAKKLHEQLGIRVPNSITEKAKI